jgi:hypothetical protein
MYLKSKYADFFLRVGIGLLLGLFFGWLLSEGSYLFLDAPGVAKRDPRRVEIVIPYGTSEQVEEGGYNRSIPTDMVFVQGDLLIVRNEDTVDHQLGPLWIPAGTSGVMSLDMAQKFVYECSFQPTQYMGLDVRPSVTGGTRLQAILSIALPTGMMLAVYSYLLPGRKKKLENEA